MHLVDPRIIIKHQKTNAGKQQQQQQQMNKMKRQFQMCIRKVKNSADFNNNMSTLAPSFEIILWALLVLQSR